MALRDIGRVIGLPYGRVDQLSKMIEVGSNAIEELIVLQKSSLEQ